ncbi:hypothetical protein F8388_014883 [Cannabis sativa]|uniref:Uncharacterized protein n=1 Tax=Cannabis sativa TaxID=3483 RepID=A0A7J6F674_CANSA|nr:hypothetical protein F8388_014883 [Cannabis sativa]
MEILSRQLTALAMQFPLAEAMNFELEEDHVNGKEGFLELIKKILNSCILMENAPLTMTFIPSNVVKWLDLINKTVWGMFGRI